MPGVFHATVTDHLGSGSLTRDEAGATAVQRYTPFGANRGGASNSLPTDRTFTGQTDDPGTGLIDYNARAYDPLLGRFTMADTILDGLNRYTYVHNNPVGFTDPSGHCSVWDPVDCVADATDAVTGIAESVVDFASEACINAGSGADDCNSIAEQHPEGAQRVVDAAAGTLEAVTYGNSEELLAASGNGEKYIDTGSGSYYGGLAGGTAFNIWAGGGGNGANVLRFGTTAGGINAASTCTGNSSGNCAIDTAVAFVPFVASKAATGAFSSLGGAVAARGSFLGTRPISFMGGARAFWTSGSLRSGMRNAGWLRGGLGRITSSMWADIGGGLVAVAPAGGRIAADAVSAAGAAVSAAKSNRYR